MQTLDQALADFRATFQAVQQEAKARAEIEASEEYQAFQRIIEGAQAEQAEMLAKISDTREEHEMDKKDLMRLMQESDMLEAGEFKAVPRNVNRVDTRAVLEAFYGDIDNLMLVSSITQKALEKFIKDNPEYKRDLRKCIVNEGYKIVDIVPAA